MKQYACSKLERPTAHLRAREPARHHHCGASRTDSRHRAPLRVDSGAYSLKSRLTRRARGSPGWTVTPAGTRGAVGATR